MNSTHVASPSSATKIIDSPPDADPEWPLAAVAPVDAPATPPPAGGPGKDPEPSWRGRGVAAPEVRSVDRCAACPRRSPTHDADTALHPPGTANGEPLAGPAPANSRSTPAASTGAGGPGNAASDESAGGPASPGARSPGAAAVGAASAASAAESSAVASGSDTLAAGSALVGAELEAVESGLEPAAAAPELVVAWPAAVEAGSEVPAAGSEVPAAGSEVVTAGFEPVPGGAAGSGSVELAAGSEAVAGAEPVAGAFELVDAGSEEPAAGYSVVADSEPTGGAFESVEAESEAVADGFGPVDAESEPLAPESEDVAAGSAGDWIVTSANVAEPASAPALATRAHHRTTAHIATKPLCLDDMTGTILPHRGGHVPPATSPITPLVRDHPPAADGRRRAQPQACGD